MSKNPRGVVKIANLFSIYSSNLQWLGEVFFFFQIIKWTNKSANHCVHRLDVSAKNWLCPKMLLAQSVNGAMKTQSILMCAQNKMKTNMRVPLCVCFVGCSLI